MEEIQQPAITPTQPVVNQTPTSTPPSLQTVSPTRRMPKILLILVFVIIIALLGFGGFYFYKNTNSTKVVTTPSPTLTVAKPTPTPDPTANWKTLQNSNGNFSISIPQSFNIWALGGPYGNPDPTTDGLLYISSHQTNINDPDGVITIGKKVDSTRFMNKTLQQIANESYQLDTGKIVPTIITSSPNKVSSEVDEIVFAGKNAYQYKLTTNSQNVGQSFGSLLPYDSYQVTLIEHDQNIIQIVLPQDKIFDQILSTFKFTDN